MYVAVKGGEAAISNAHAWLAEERRALPRRPGRAVVPVAQVVDTTGAGDSSEVSRAMAAP